MRNKLLRLAILSIAMQPFADGMAHGFDVDAPHLRALNEFTVGGVFLRPGGSNDYAVLVYPFNPDVPTPILSPSWEPKGINANFKAGFLLNFRHVFSHSGNDFTLYWAHLRATDNDTFPVDRQPPPAQQMTGPFWNIGPDAGTTSTANGQLNNHYDVLHAEVGKKVKFDPDLYLRFFSGVSGLWLNQRITADFTGIDPILGFYTFGINTQSKYSAAGMRLGITGEYQRKCLSAVGLLAGNIYIGSLRPSTTSEGTGSTISAAGIPENHQSIFHGRFTQIVPALDAKLGIRYSQHSFAIEAGYMASIYVNAIQNYVPSTYVPGSLGLVTGSVFLQSLLKTTESFSVDGPYVNVSVIL